MINYIDKDTFDNTKEHGKETHINCGYGIFELGHSYDGKFYVRIYQPKENEKYFYITCDNKKEWKDVREHEGKEKQFITFHNRKHKLKML